MWDQIPAAQAPVSEALPAAGPRSAHSRCSGDNYFHLGNSRSQSPWEGGRTHTNLQAGWVFTPKTPPLLLPASWPTWQVHWRGAGGCPQASAMSGERRSLRDHDGGWGDGGLRPHGAGGCTHANRRGHPQSYSRACPCLSSWLVLSVATNASTPSPSLWEMKIKST